MRKGSLKIYIFKRKVIYTYINICIYVLVIINLILTSYKIYKLIDK